MTTAIKYQSDFNEHINFIKKEYPNISEAINFDKVEELIKFIVENNLEVTDFETEFEDTRGSSYIKAQEEVLVRSKGIEGIMKLFSEDSMEKLCEKTILDLLGGNGLIFKVVQTLFPTSYRPSIITSDISKGMIDNALNNNILAIRQPAQKLLFKDDSVEGVLLAYGTHHIPKNQRLETVCEAKRVLKKGGKLIIHDFEEGGPVARWFSDVVHPFSLTGHDFPHFNKEELEQYFYESDFKEYKIEYLYDPFILIGETEKEVKNKFTDYLLNMYGLEKLIDLYPNNMSNEKLFEKAEEIFKYNYEDLNLYSDFGKEKITITLNNNKFHLEMPRVAIVGIGVK
ncbi:class I SAM-dependent methyltransferase [Psychrobacillus glaciei]|nr:class I SAM-dependent methyltransferase [Psychrobacillus glaciei]